MRPLCRRIFGIVACVLLVGVRCYPADGWGIHISLKKLLIPPVPIPHPSPIHVGPITITPAGPVPTKAIPAITATTKQAAKVIDTTAHAVANVAVSGAKATVSPAVQITKVIAGQEHLSAAAQNLIVSKGDEVKAIGEAVSETNAVVNNLPVVAASSIAGTNGKVVMSLGSDTNRLAVEFAATTLIESGGILAGQQSPEAILASPLAAALRSAEKEFEVDAKPLPPDVKAALASSYPAEVLENARWTVGYLSITAPGSTIEYQDKIKGHPIFAVTVGHVTVFSVDPGKDYHWWAHELYHQLQYHNLGIDQFALNYIKNCHAVETDAENMAQKVIPQLVPNAISC
jgi:hypothetical protein